jgi:branched-chain amino acid transport system ATP-binding protein
LLEIESLSVAYDELVAVRDVSLVAAQGSCICILGANGAGKSSLLKAIVGMARITGGDIRFEGRSLRGLQPFGRANVAADLENVFTLFPRLRERKQQAASSLSGGEQQMCAIGRALMSRPRLLLLDEPSLGLAPKIIADVAAVVRQIKATGISVVLVEQNARLGLLLADHGFVLESGRLVREGPTDVLRQDPTIVAAYLGGNNA